MRLNVPVIASKPVAKTMMSSSYSPSSVRMPGRRDLLDRRVADVDQGDVVAVVGVEVVRVDERALRRERMVDGHELLGDLGVLHDARGSSSG